MIEGPGYVVFGAGGHGKVLADMMLSQGLCLLGFVDDGVMEGSPVLADGRGTIYSVLGPGSWLSENKTRALGVALGVGNNRVRQRVAQLLLAQGVPIATVVHPSAVVSRFSVVEQGAVVMAGAVVNPSAYIGAGAIVNTGAVVEHDAFVAEYSHISPNATMAGAARLGTLSHLGSGAVVLPGIAVGANCIVGAGAVVNRNISDRTVVAGVPARRLRSVED